MTPGEVEERVEAGLAALARNEWREAHRLLADADHLHPLSPENLEQLATAAWWSGELDACVSALERAFAGYSAAGNDRRAAGTALELARQASNRGKLSVSTGWAQRARRLLEANPDCAEAGIMAVMQSGAARARGDFEASAHFAQQAVELGQRHGARDLWALALHHQGQALVSMGNVEEGMGMIDEATAAATGGELSPLYTGTVYCLTISTCRDLGDFGRASEWTAEANRWCEQRSISGFPGICRIHRAELMRLRGAWRLAEAEVLTACQELPNFNPKMAAVAFAELGEIRVRSGDLAGAEDALRQAHELGDEAQPGMAMLLAARGNLRAAESSIRTAVESTAERSLARARLLPAQAQIALAAGHSGAAEAAVAEMEDIAERFNSAAFRTSALMWRGGLEALAGSPAAVNHLRAALRGWREIDAPYEGALTRLLLARALRASDDSAAAEAETEAGQSALARLGAPPPGPPFAGAAVASVRRALMFTDIVRSTELVSAVGDTAWASLVRWHDQALRDTVSRHGGEVANHTGDGFLFAFLNPGAAFEAAIAIQRLLEAHRREHGFAPEVRIGVHAADANPGEGGYRGRGVHEAARIAAAAGPGEIVASADTAALVPSARTSEPRSVALKGLAQPVEIVTLTWL